MSNKSQRMSSLHKLSYCLKTKIILQNFYMEKKVPEYFANF